MMRQIWYALIVAGFVLISALIYVKLPFALSEDGVATNGASAHASSTILIADSIVAVEIADTSEERARGLSGRDGLAEGKGMLFVFDEDGKHAFWMKDMRFAIDIIWVSRNGVIVHIEEHVAPETYPEVFAPRFEARYVVELSAGFVERYDVRVGDIVRL